MFKLRPPRHRERRVITLACCSGRVKLVQIHAFVKSVLPVKETHVSA